jgi:uncharacterized protein (TIGR03437 family)
VLGAFAGMIHAAGTVFSTLLHGSGQDFATAVASDAQGNVYVAGLTYSADFPVTAGAFQTTFGGTCDAFIAKVGPDGKLVWSTYLGGILDDWATGVALDGAGNVLVAGYTRSANFPLVNPIQSTLDNGVSDDYDAFVAKFDPNGARLLYSTYLGGQDIDGAAGIAVDSAGNAYVAVNSNSSAGYPGTQNAPNQFGIFITKLAPQGALVYSYLHPFGTAGGIALDAANSVYIAGSSSSTNPSSATQTFGSLGAAYAMVFKISPDGSKKLFESAIGGSVQSSASAIAVDGAGEAYIAGSTTSADFPLAGPLQTSPGARPLWKSADSGATWTPLDNLPFALLQTLLVDPSTPATLYQATGDLGIFKSLNGGATWAATNSGIASANIAALAIDPAHPQTLYAATASTVDKSTDGANTWAAIDSPPFPVTQILVDAQNPNVVYEVGANIRKSADGGATWNSVTFPGTVASMTLDPRVSGHIFAVSAFVFCGVFCGNSQPPYLYRSVDGGATWIQVPSVAPASPGMLVDGSTNPSTVYAGLAWRSVDGGVTWSAIGSLPFDSSTTGAVAVDADGNLYAAVSGGGSGNFLSRDQARTWASIGSFIPPWPFETAGPSITRIVPAAATGTIYAGINQIAASGFISRLSADGSTLHYSTYLRGHPSMQSFPTYLAEPDAVGNQTWISGIAVDSSGNIVVAGGTRSADLPAANPAQAANAGLADAFAAILSPDGGTLKYSTYFGGSADDGALALGLDSTGDVILAGQTWSSDFPVPGGSQTPFSYGDGFVVKLVTGPPAITSVLNGASFQPGIEGGSWATIKGANLSNTTRTWTSADFVGNNLPTSLDGVSVTIDGEPAFVSYISPTQINVQAPSDSALGAVNVVVDNNGAFSAPASAQFEAVAPAFFVYLDNVIASRSPDYTLVGTPASPAMPGDTLVLWGTGFGATTPPFPAGTVVSGAPAPAVTPLPAVTVGGMPVPVIGAVLTVGSAGLCQVTIQLPSNVPTGTVAVEASVGGVPSAAGVTIFVGTP